MGTPPVLLVEDNADDEFLTLRELARGGLSDVAVVRDGCEALEALLATGDEALRPGLVLLDLQLPKIGGLELLARLRAVTRRATRPAGPPGTESPPELVVGRLRVNTGSHTAVLGDQALELTPVEFDLLASLARARGRVKSREQLLEEIRDRNFDVFDRSIDVHISALRKKLGDDPKEPRFIRTVRAAGYMLINPEA